MDVAGALLSVLGAAVLVSTAVIQGSWTPLALSLLADAIAFGCIGLALYRRRTRRVEPPRARDLPPPGLPGLQQASP
jgi:hypothetical protein